ncbi:MAG: hypothetical protein AB1631_33885 [Acidobacteriota bacterium]
MSEEIALSKERSCYRCKNFRLCFLRRRIDEVVLHAAILNIDGTGAPAGVTDIFIMLAHACTEFKRETDGKDDQSC